MSLEYSSSSDVEESSPESEVLKEKEAVVSLLDRLKAPTPADIARPRKRADVSEEFDPLDWWKRNSSTLPHWSACAKKILLIQPSSAAAERVFSLLKASFGDQQESCLQDYVQTSLMLQYNKR